MPAPTGATTGPTVDLVNIALLRIGANTISDLSENSPNAKKANILYTLLRDEVLQARDWRFAKVRAELSAHSIDPEYGYDYAYALPNDFLRLVRPPGPLSRIINPASFPLGGYGDYWNPVTGTFYYPERDAPVYPALSDYKIETIPGTDEVAATLCLLTDYDDTDDSLYINYIQRVEDEDRYSPTFKSCLIYRLAQDLAVAITENINKAKEMERLYFQTLYSATAVTESYDYLANETGSNQWADAGR